MNMEDKIFIQTNINKFLKRSIETYDNLNRQIKSRITSSKDPNINYYCSLYKEKDLDYIIEIKVPTIKAFELFEFNNVEIDDNNYTIHVDKILIHSSVGSYNSGTAGENFYKLIGKITSFVYLEKNICSLNEFLQGQNKTFYRKLIIPLTEDISFAYFIKTKGYSYNNFYSNTLIELNINDKKFHFYFYKNGKYNFLLIDSLDLINFEDFYKYTYSILISFGFLTGKLPARQAYYFTSIDKDFHGLISVHCKALQDSIDSVYNVIYGNSYAYKQIIGEDKAEYYYKKLKPINEDLFSQICEKVHNEEKLQRAIMLMLLANTYEILSASAIYSVVLETLSRIIEEKHKEIITPIKDKDLWNTFKTDILRIFEKGIKPNIEDKDAQQTLIKKIDSLNSQTNNELLYKPFEIYEIELNEKEKEAIKYRNIILHGNKPNIKINECINNPDSFGKQFYITLRLHNIINKFLLKYFGYNGKMINHVKLFENITGIKIDDEEYFVDV
jgi:hypothetical protein